MLKIGGNSPLATPTCVGTNLHQQIFTGFEQLWKKVVDFSLPNCNCQNFSETFATEGQPQIVQTSVSRSK